MSRSAPFPNGTSQAPNIPHDFFLKRYLKSILIVKEEIDEDDITGYITATRIPRLDPNADKGKMDGMY
jgi:hypothetical protein